MHAEDGRLREPEKSRDYFYQPAVHEAVAEYLWRIRERDAEK